MKPLTVPVSEFCRLIGIKRTKAFAMIRAHEVVAVRLGRKTLVTLESIERLIEQRSDSVEA